MHLTALTAHPTKRGGTNMKLIHLLDVLEGPTVIWIASETNPDGVFHGFAEDAYANTPGYYLFGDVESVYAEYYRSYDRAGVSILVKPYESR